MAVFMHCAALLSFSPEIFKSAVIMARAVMKHCFQAINFGTCSVWIVFPVSTCSVPHCVVGSLCCDVCVRYIRVETRGGER